MRTVAIRCRPRGHLLATAEVHQGYAVVTPAGVNVGAGDGRQRGQVTRGAAAAADRFTITAAGVLSHITTAPSCRCGEHAYPEDLWDQVVSRGVILADRGARGGVVPGI